jgi:N-acetylmuramic acid 6-phosphate etherase
MNDVVTPDSLTWATEQAAAASAGIDQLPTRGLVDLIVAHDAGVVDAVKAVAQQVAEAADLMVAAIEAGGVVHYVGAGTSGRLGILDAVELFPTYDAGPEVVRAHLAGGDQAMMSAVEGAEDDAAAGRGGRRAGERTRGRHRGVGTYPLRSERCEPPGARPPYRAGVDERGCAAAEYADVAVLPDTGPEVVTARRV